MEALSSLSAVFPAWILWPVVVGIALYWYLTKNHGYWKGFGIPYLTPLPLLGSIGKALLNPVHKIELKNYKEKGRIYGAYEGSRPVLYVADPDVLRDILVKDFHFFSGRRLFIPNSAGMMSKILPNLRGEDWKRVRTIISPTFTTGKIRKMTVTVLNCAKTLSNNLKAASMSDKPVNVKNLFGTFGMDVIASTAFGIKLDSHKDSQNPFVTVAKTVFGGNLPWRQVMSFMAPSLMKILRISMLPSNVTEFFTNAVLTVIEERKRTGQRGNDLLQLLMDAEKDIDKGVFHSEKEDYSELGQEETSDENFKPLRITKFLSSEELVAQSVLFLISGYDSTAASMGSVVYEMAVNPDIQERLIEEIDDSIRRKGDLCYETISEMRYLDQVLSESLRKYPPAMRSERKADADYVIKKYDLTVEKGVIVVFPIYAMQHDPEHYPDPEKFDPERFTSEAKGPRHPYTYLPFGAGPRNCVAMRFALMQVKVGLAYLLSQVRFRTCAETQIPMQYNVGNFNLIPKEVTVKVEIRKDAPKCEDVDTIVN